MGITILLKNKCELFIVIVMKALILIKNIFLIMFKVFWIFMINVAKKLWLLLIIKRKMTRCWPDTNKKKQNQVAKLGTTRKLALLIMLIFSFRCTNHLKAWACLYFFSSYLSVLLITVFFCRTELKVVSRCLIWQRWWYLWLEFYRTFANLWVDRVK